MAARGVQVRSVCLFCRSRRVAFGCQRIHTSPKRRGEQVAVRSEDDGFLLEDEGSEVKISTEDTTVTRDETPGRWASHIPLKDIREAYLGLESLVRLKDFRVKALQRLSNPWPLTKELSIHNQGRPTRDNIELPEAGAGPVPHGVFKHNLKTAVGSKAIRIVLRAQLLRCQRPQDILRVVAVAMQHPKTAHSLAIIYDAIMRALYRCRIHVSDPDILKYIRVIVARFDMAALPVNQQLIQMGFKFAARARSVREMQHFLRIQRVRHGDMSSNQFRSVIAKCSIGHRGLGEIRNGRWKKADLMQVLTGFNDCQDLAEEEQYHLGTFLNREDWQYLHGWIAILARCKASSVIWDEWLLWLLSPARIHPRSLQSADLKMNTRTRGDYWFVEQMAYTGDLEKAWQMLEESGLPIMRFRARIRHLLLERVECATVWTPEIGEVMLQKYDADLRQIETALGVLWETSDSLEDAGGQHILFRDQEEALDELGANGWRPSIDYGFPYDDDRDAKDDEVAIEEFHEGMQRGSANGGTLFAAEQAALHEAKETAVDRSSTNI